MKAQSAKRSWLRPLNKYRQAKDLKDYFDQRVETILDNGCWLFATKGDKDGYPQVTGSVHCQQEKLTRAHQVSYHLHKGPIPEDKIVCHTCDNPGCVNPDHLFLGTWNDNVQDMMRKGRYRHPGLTHKLGKLSKEQKEEIKSLKGIESCMVVGPRYGVSFSHVCSIWRGER